jgi:hypothetical protein
LVIVMIKCKSDNDALSGLPGRLGCPPPAT